MLQPIRCVSFVCGLGEPCLYLEFFFGATSSILVKHVRYLSCSVVSIRLIRSFTHYLVFVFGVGREGKGREGMEKERKGTQEPITGGRLTKWWDVKVRAQNNGREREREREGEGEREEALESACVRGVETASLC